MASSPSSPESVRSALQHAIEQRLPVTVVIRGNLEAGLPARIVRGTPVDFDLSRGGVERVTVEVAEGETLQKIVLERIERVLPASG